MPATIPWSSLIGTVIRARFIDRPNRFLIRCEGPDGQRLLAHLPNPGRLWELLLPGVTVLLRPAVSRARQPRKTRFSVLAVERDGVPILQDTQLSNEVARRLIEGGRIPSLRGAAIVRREVTAGRSRFDFLMRDGSGEFLLEVKSVTLFGNGVAMFPDAPTARGRRHLLELAAAPAARGATRPTVLFLVHSSRIRELRPDYHTDLPFARTLLELRPKLRIIVAAIGWRRALGLPRKVTELLIPWDPVGREAADRGAYLLILRLPRRRLVEVGRLGRLPFARGYWIYVGSAMQNLDARIARHLRLTKQHRWHIDYLRRVAAEARGVPIRSSARLECALAEALGAIMASGPRGFGCSDCHCPTHLFYSAEPPLARADFIAVLQAFRMPPAL